MLNENIHNQMRTVAVGLFGLDPDLDPTDKFYKLIAVAFYGHTLDEDILEDILEVKPDLDPASPLYDRIKVLFYSDGE